MKSDKIKVRCPFRDLPICNIAKDDEETYGKVCIYCSPIIGDIEAEPIENTNSVTLQENLDFANEQVKKERVKFVKKLESLKTSYGGWTPGYMIHPEKFENLITKLKAE